MRPASGHARDRCPRNSFPSQRVGGRASAWSQLNNHFTAVSLIYCLLHCTPSSHRTTLSRLFDLAMRPPNFCQMLLPDRSQPRRRSPHTFAASSCTTPTVLSYRLLLEKSIRLHVTLLSRGLGLVTARQLFVQLSRALVSILFGRTRRTLCVSFSRPSTPPGKQHVAPSSVVQMVQT